MDYEKDFVVVKKIIEFFNEKDIIFVEDIISFLDANKNLKEINSEYSFNEGYKTSMDKK